MAHMYPDPISPETDSDAERKMYQLFKDKLSDEYTVIHGCKWVAINRDGGAREGECDFIIAHPKHGVLCVEIKGGGIKVDTTGGQEQWYSVDRHGKTHPLSRSPIQQVQDSQYALRDKLAQDKRTNPFWKSVGRQVRWAVCFPDVDVAIGRDLGPNTPGELVIDGSRAAAIQKTIHDIFSYWHGKDGLPSDAEVGASGVNALTEVLAPSWELKALKSIAYADAIRRLEKLIEDQFVVLTHLAGATRAVVTGGAGTGKTLLAMEQARRLAEEMLWSSQGEPALNYLLGRGLNTSTIREARLGYVPGGFYDWRERAGLKVPCGILIPWFANGALWAVKVRRASGMPKYLQIAGGSSHGLYNADSLGNNSVALFCEGEFDALLVQQEAGNLMSAVTLGSATARLTARWYSQLVRHRTILVSYDRDPAGERGTQRLLCLSGRFRSLPVPHGKDISDFHLDGGDIYSWIAAALDEKQAVLEAIPDGC